MRASASDLCSEAIGTARGRATERITIAICTKNRPIELARAVQSIRDSSPLGRAADILVVEESDKPRTVEGIRYVHIPPRGLGFGHARNVAVSHVHRELVVFIDDDCIAERGWLEALVGPFEQDPTVLGVAGAVLVRDCGVIGYAENILGFPGGGLRYFDRAAGKLEATHHLSTCNCAYRRSAILEVGGFVEHARRGGEDAVLAEQVSRLGLCLYTPAAVVYHRTRDSLTAVFRWFMRRGESEIAMLAGPIDRSRHVAYLLRSSWTLRVLVLIPLIVGWPELMRLLSVIAVGYYGAILWRFRFARRYATHRRAWWWVPIVKGAMELGTEVGRWKAWLSGKGR
jgi:GT2 family glycosyltransferase